MVLSATSRFITALLHQSMLVVKISPFSQTSSNAYAHQAGWRRGSIGNSREVEICHAPKLGVSAQIDDYGRYWSYNARRLETDDSAKRAIWARRGLPPDKNQGRTIV